MRTKIMSSVSAFFALLHVWIKKDIKQAWFYFIGVMFYLSGFVMGIVDFSQVHGLVDSDATPFKGLGSMGDLLHLLGVFIMIASLLSDAYHYTFGSVKTSKRVEPLAPLNDNQLMEIAENRDKSARRAVKSILKNPTTAAFTRIYALQALGEIGDWRDWFFVELMTNAQNETHQIVRDEAKKTKDRISQRMKNSLALLFMSRKRILWQSL